MLWYKAILQSYITKIYYKRRCCNYNKRAVNLKRFNHLSYKQFDDYEVVSDYAKSIISICKDIEMLQGYPDGSIKPKN